MRRIGVLFGIIGMWGVGFRCGNSLSVRGVGLSPNPLSAIAIKKMGQLVTYFFADDCREGAFLCLLKCLGVLSLAVIWDLFV